MSVNAEKIYNIIFRAINGDTWSQKDFWPEKDGMDKKQVITIIDNYRDLVKDKGFSLPNSDENIKALSNEIKKRMRLPSNSLAPTNVILSIIKYLDTSNIDLYAWAFPGSIKQDPKPEPFNWQKFFTDFKWIMIAGVAGYALYSTGALRKIIK